ncbi:phenylacetate--CoA ligase family protein [Candidatus Methanarcanum hacksteinii]|uniref:phenylacetate--CoA ligase family protein n=1 Tax=Candidatus Methanarcanum hacksteinii TaxID=2911857 RepID=UPI0037DC8B61
MTYWNEKIETMPKEDLKAMQLELLKELVKNTYRDSKFYRERMDAAGVKPEDIKTLDDIRKLPFMKKTDLRDNYPDKLFVRPYDDLVRIHVSSGTTGKPTVVGYTRNDLDNWAESLDRGMVSFGMSKSDMLQNAHGYGLFTGGIGVHDAATRLGATVLPISTGNTNRQIDLMCDLPVTAIAGTPSYLFHIADTCDERGIDIRKDTKLRLAIAGGEPWSESMRKKLQDRTGIRVHNCYGASEFYGPMFLECKEQCGVHVWADLALIEILDNNDNPVPDGQKGNVVVTMLKKEAFPLIRYRIGDITSITWERCKCGRTHPRLDRITGRSDDMLVVKGINVFPSQIEAVIGEMPFLSPFYMITLDNKNYSDHMLVEVELNENSLTDDTTELAKMAKKLDSRLKEVLNIKAEVRLALPKTLQRFEGKSKHVIDNRSYE